MSDDALTVFARIPKNASSKEELFVALTTFKSHDLCDLRFYYPDENSGGMRPGPKGVCFRIGLLPQVLNALQKCQVEAIKRGLLPGKVDADDKAA